MKAEIFIHYGFRLKRKSKKVYRKSLKQVAKAKRNLISCINTTTHYCSEINTQAKVFKNNLNDLNRFENENSERT